VLPEALAALPCVGVAVVQSTPPDWVVLAYEGVPSKHVPTSMAAEALDRESVVREQDWAALPLATNYALLIQSELDDNDLGRFQAALSEAFQLVLSQQNRDRRIRRLEKILEITHAWGQTNCTEALLQAMAEAATELLAADRASIFLWDKPNKTLVARPALGVEDEHAHSRQHGHRRSGGSRHQASTRWQQFGRRSDRAQRRSRNWLSHSDPPLCSSGFTYRKVPRRF